jgi:hypothetical protein
MEVALQRSTVTSKRDWKYSRNSNLSSRRIEAAQNHENVGVKPARALTFWTSLGLLFSIQVYRLWPEVAQLPLTRQRAA